jgi:aminoglycoside phosphotransferase family enzyme
MITPRGAEVRETNTSIVFLVGNLAYKMKKPVDLGFLDFRTVEARHRACAAELLLNRRLAPDVYLDLTAIISSGGQITEHVLVMKRMPDELRLSTLIRNGVNVDDHVRALARLLAAFHSTARRDESITAEAIGGLRRRWTDNLRETERFRGNLLPDGLHEQISDLALRYLDGRTVLLNERAAQGLAVDGHGDLIADDIFCLPDYPRVLDCIEFDDRLRFVDTLDDAAFLAMDLEHLGHPELARQFMRWYVEFSATPTTPSLEHHYVAYRAFVRAKVECIRAQMRGDTQSAELERYATQALEHLKASRVRLILVGGAPATGKSTLASHLADELGAVLIRTDVVRRELDGVDPRDRYTTWAKDAAYQLLLRRARSALERGESVVADATWSKDTDRKEALELAAETFSELHSIECVVSTEIATERARLRSEAGLDVSEAGPAQVALLTERDPWPEAYTVDTSGSAEASLAQARSHLA